MLGNFRSHRTLCHAIRYMLFVQTKTTPNPNFLKFIPTGKTVMKSGTMDITALKYATVSPLARKLFAVDGVTRVFYGADYVSIAKAQNADWQAIKPQVFALLEQQFQSDLPLLVDYEQPDDTRIDPNDSQAVQLIKEILSTRIRPTVQEDGGDIKYEHFDQATGQVQLMMMGSCSGCPSSGVTLKNGIQKMLKHYVSEVKSVVARDFDGQKRKPIPTTK